MPKPQRLGAKPAVLRCARCGRFVDWEEARLQVIDACRPHLELAGVLVRPGEEADRAGTLELIRQDFGDTRIEAFGENLSAELAPFFVAELKGELAGALAYRLISDAAQIIALATAPMWQRAGVGGQLLLEIERLTRACQLPRLAVSTTNDNLPALYFYQRHGYRVSEWLSGGLEHHGQTVGFAGIPIRDEIRLEKRF